MRDRLRLGLVGHPVAHSLSPTLHAAAARAVGHPDADVPDLYRLFDRGLAELDPFMAHEARALTGFNVTVPAKVAIVARLDACTSTANRLGAVNTVWRTATGWSGDNTDVSGFAASVADLEPGVAVVLGAGGAARAVVCALADAGWRELRVVARDPTAARALVTRLAPDTGRPLPFDALTHALQGADLVVQATSAALFDPLAFSDLAFAGVARDAVAVDLVYRPLETAFLAAAARAGLETRDGLDMLVRQGLAAFERFTGCIAPYATVAAAVRAAASLDTPHRAS
jgi:shikimate dehydrogenase